MIEIMRNLWACQQQALSTLMTSLFVLTFSSSFLSTKADEDVFNPRRILSFGSNGNGLGEVECSDVRNVNSSFQCSFVKELDDCHYSSGFIQYNRFVYCQFQEQSSWALVVLVIVLFYLFIALGLTAEEFFCPCLKTFSKTLRMSDSVAGVTLLALGNGAPDIFSVLAAMTSEGQDTAPLAFQELFGAGIFVTTVVAGSIQLRNSFKLARRPFIRDLLFYISAVGWTFAVMYRKDIQTAEAIGFIVLYVIYVTLVIAGQAVNRTMRSRRATSVSNDPIINTGEEDVNSKPQSWRRRAWIEDLHASADFTEFEPPNERSLLIGAPRYIPTDKVNDDSSVERDHVQIYGSSDSIADESILERLTGIEYREWKEKAVIWKIFDIIKIPLAIVLSITNPVIDIDSKGYKWHKFLIMLQCVVSPVMCAFITEKAYVDVAGGFVVWEILLMIGGFVALIVMVTTKMRKPPKFHFVFAIAGFVVSVIWIYAFAQEIVNLLKTFGVSLGISNAVLGLTLLAWGNSIGDFVSNLAMAKNGAPRMAIAACYGGPLLNMVLGVGISCTVSSLTHNGDIKLIRGHLQYIISASFLGTSLVAALILMPMLKFNSSKFVGIFLIFLYSSYLVISLLNEFGFIPKPK